MRVLVMAKSPVPSEVKTRLCPPLTPAQAASAAAAALLDTMDAIEEFAARDHPGIADVLALSGQLTSAPDGPAIAGRLAFSRRWVRQLQRGNGLAERLVNAHADAFDKPGSDHVLQIGMDTPQISVSLLALCAEVINPSEVDAVLGLAEDGGWWALGAKGPQAARALRGVAMSTSWTGLHTLQALQRAGLRVALLPQLRDVDTIDDADYVAGRRPAGRFAAALRSFDRVGAR